ncbi:MAG: hypothetical protein SF069_12455 [Phycisphaerae bacterium]|nr:hypothetical protein [Phycisphaerae bacterium]
MDLRNSTALPSARLAGMILRHTTPYRHDRLQVRIRYSRGAPFSGTCDYRKLRLTVNLGRENEYPYSLVTHIARAQSTRTHWWREGYILRLASAEQLVLFVYLHELYHYLVFAAGRCTRQKEGMCDRFATRVLVDDYGCELRDARGGAVSRESWDFQDLHAFVRTAPRIAITAAPPEWQRSLFDPPIGEAISARSPR